MLLTSERHGDILRAAIEDGLSAAKALEVADMCGAWVAKNVRCSDCTGDICTGCKENHHAPEWDHSAYNAERISETLMRYTRKSADELEEGQNFDPTLARIFIEVPKLMKIAKAAVARLKEAKSEMAVLEQAAARSSKKAEMASDLLKKQDAKLKEKDDDIDQLKHKVELAEDRLQNVMRLTMKSTSAEKKDPSAWDAPYYVPRKTKLAGVDPFDCRGDYVPRSIESSSYLDVEKIPIENSGSQADTGRGSSGSFAFPAFGSH
jgi:hypothetical protein